MKDAITAMLAGTIVTIGLAVVLKFVIIPAAESFRFGTYSPAIAQEKANQVRHDYQMEANSENGSHVKIKTSWYFEKSTGLYRVTVSAD